MIISMTGFGESVLELRNTTYTIELKSLNSKGTEITLRCPSLFRNLEILLKNNIQKNLQRGKIDISISSTSTKKGTLEIDESLFIEQYNTLKTLAEKVEATDKIFSLALSYSNINPEIEILTPEEIKIIETQVQAACDQLYNYRKTEGVPISEDLILWINDIESSLQKIIATERKRIDLKREKLNQSVKELKEKFEIDSARFEQELIFYIEKLDISEEISRLTQHIKLFRDTTLENEMVGKKLNFISQEIGREINTIGSKSNDYELQHLVVNMKDQLEKIKEQLNNVL